MVPDELFDELLPLLSGSELKVLLYIIRRTFGFKRDSDTISLSQMLNGITTREGTVLDRGAGVSKPSLLQALRALQDRNIVFAERQESDERGFEPTRYRLNVAQDLLGKESYPPLVKKVDQGHGKQTLPRARSRKLTIQETVEQETVRQETDLHNSNIRMAQRKKRGEGTTETLPSEGSGAAPAAVESVGEVLARNTKPKHSGPRPETETEEWQVIQEYISDLSRLLGDDAPLKSSTTRAYHLFERSGRPLGDFIGRLYQARALTQESSASITKTTTDGRGLTRKSKMAYFFAVLEDQLGLAADRPQAKAPTRRTKSPPAEEGESQTRPRRSEGYEDYVAT